MSGIECDSRWIGTVGGTAFVGCGRVSERVGDGLWRDSDRKLVCPVVSGHFEMIRVFKSSVTGMGPVPPAGPGMDRYHEGLQFDSVETTWEEFQAHGAGILSRST